MAALNNVCLTHELFQPEKSLRCDLLISISENNLSYAIIDQESEVLEVLFDRDFASPIDELLQELIGQQKLLSLPFRKTKISVCSFNFTFIPQAFYSESFIADYARFISCTGGSEVLVNSIRPARIKNVFRLPVGLSSKLLPLFPQAQIYSQATVFIESARRVMNETHKVSLFLGLQHSSLQAAVVSRAGLLYYNVFSCPTADDLNYYLLFLIRKLKLELAQTHVTMAGCISAGSDSYARVRKYFDDVSFADSRRIVYHPVMFDRIPSQTYLMLLGLSLCE